MKGRWNLANKNRNIYCGTRLGGKLCVLNKLCKKLNSVRIERYEEELLYVICKYVRIVLVLYLSGEEL